MIERYCKKCGFEIVRKGDCATFYYGKKICGCDDEDFESDEETEDE